MKLARLYVHSQFLTNQQQIWLKGSHSSEVFTKFKEAMIFEYLFLGSI